MTSLYDTANQALEALLALREQNYRLEFCPNRECTVCRRNAKIKQQAEEAIAELKRIRGISR